MKTLYSYIGGSKLYNLPTTDDSDFDYYFIGTSSKIDKPKIYPEPKIHQKKRTYKMDLEKIELCAYMTYLMSGSVFQIESLFIPERNIRFISEDFKELIIKNRNKLIDRTRIIENISCNIEYIRERKISDIIKAKKRAEERKASKKILRGIDRMTYGYKNYGYYYKDYLHAIRILSSFLYFFKNDFLELKLDRIDDSAFNICSDIKENKYIYSKEKLDKILCEYLDKLDSIDLLEDESKFCFNSIHAQTSLNKLYS